MKVSVAKYAEVVKFKPMLNQYLWESLICRWGSGVLNSTVVACRFLLSLTLLGGACWFCTLEGSYSATSVVNGTLPSSSQGPLMCSNRRHASPDTGWNEKGQGCCLLAWSFLRELVKRNHDFVITSFRAFDVLRNYSAVKPIFRLGLRGGAIKRLTTL